jgi:SMC interacting uncharacterized protein involved in chromosome segregation
MAQITMDSSEWEAMKKVEALLEKSIEEKDDLHAQIVELNAEKLEVLQNSAQNVTITTKNETVESVMATYSSDQVLERVRNYFERGGGRRGNSHPEYQMRNMDGNFSGFIEMFFQRNTHTKPTETSVTRVGLDEYIKSLTTELREEIDSNVKIELKGYLKLKERHAIVYDENTKLKRKNTGLENENINLNGVAKDLRIEGEDVKIALEEEKKKLEQRDNEYDALQEILRGIQGTVAQQPTGLFIGSMTFKVKLLQLLKEKENGKEGL